MQKKQKPSCPLKISPKIDKQDPELTRGSEDGQLTLKLFSHEEVMWLLHDLSTWNHRVHSLMCRIINILLFFLKGVTTLATCRHDA